MMIIKFITESLCYLPEGCSLFITVGLITFPWLTFHYGPGLTQGPITCQELSLSAGSSFWEFDFINTLRLAAFN